MKVGGKRTITVPLKMGYGSQRMGGDIPPNSTLVFDVELKAVSWVDRRWGIVFSHFCCFELLVLSRDFLFYSQMSKLNKGYWKTKMTLYLSLDSQQEFWPFLKWNPIHKRNFDFGSPCNFLKNPFLSIEKSRRKPWELRSSFATDKMK